MLFNDTSINFSNHTLLFTMGMSLDNKYISCNTISYQPNLQYTLHPLQYKLCIRDTLVAGVDGMAQIISKKDAWDNILQYRTTSLDCFGLHLPIKCCMYLNYDDFCSILWYLAPCHFCHFFQSHNNNVLPRLWSSVTSPWPPRDKSIVVVCLD